MSEDNKSVKKVHLRVLTPKATKVDETVDMVIMRCTNGDMGVLPGHETHLCVLADGVLRMMQGRRERRVAVFGGVAEVRDDQVSILTEEAYWPHEIDSKQVEQERDDLQRKLQEEKDEAGDQNNQALLKRALIKIEVSEYSEAHEADEE